MGDEIGNYETETGKIDTINNTTRIKLAVIKMETAAKLNII